MEYKRKNILIELDKKIESMISLKDKVLKDCIKKGKYRTKW